jgi:hypothetical protein
MSPTAPATRQRGPLPRTPHQPPAQRSAAVKSSPTGPRAARREAVSLDGRAQRSYPNQPPPNSPHDWVRKCGRSIKGSDTPQCTANARADNKAGLPTQGREHLGFAKLAHLVLASNLQAIRSKR